MSIDSLFTNFATGVSRQTGRAGAFVFCIAGVLIWGVSGPLFGFSDTWQLVINTSTTIITFLMVFLIQNTQNRDNAAIQAKLDELIRVSAGHNDMIGIEKLTDKELEQILKDYDNKNTPMGEKSAAIAGKAKEAHLRSKKTAPPSSDGKPPAAKRRPAPRKAAKPRAA